MTNTSYLYYKYVNLYHKLKLKLINFSFMYYIYSVRLKK